MQDVSKRPSADEVMAYADRLGLDLGASRAQRMQRLRYLARLGLIDPGERVSQGRGNGFATNFDPAIRTQLRGVRRLQKKGVPYARMPGILAESMASNVMSRATAGRPGVHRSILEETLRVLIEHGSREELLEFPNGSQLQVLLRDDTDTEEVMSPVEEMANVAMIRRLMGKVVPPRLLPEVDQILGARLDSAYQALRRAGEFAG